MADLKNSFILQLLHEHGLWPDIMLCVGVTWCAQVAQVLLSWNCQSLGSGHEQSSRTKGVVVSAMT